MQLAWFACRHNTLVCLPTGLGKTLIAAVVMYNHYRWFPTVGTGLGNPVDKLGEEMTMFTLLAWG